MKNKRADIPIVILVIGVLAICGFALLSFIVSEKINGSKNNLEVDVFEKLYSEKEKVDFYKNAGIVLTPTNSFGIVLDNNGGLVYPCNSSDGKLFISRYSPVN